MTFSLSTCICERTAQIEVLGPTGVTIHNERVILGGKGKYWLEKQVCFEVGESVGALFRPNPFGFAVSKGLKWGNNDGVVVYETSVIAGNSNGASK